MKYTWYEFLSTFNFEIYMLRCELSLKVLNFDAKMIIAFHISHVACTMNMAVIQHFDQIMNIYPLYNLQYMRCVFSVAFMLVHSIHLQSTHIYIIQSILQTRNLSHYYIIIIANFGYN